MYLIIYLNCNSKLTYPHTPSSLRFPYPLSALLLLTKDAVPLRLINTLKEFYLEGSLVEFGCINANVLSPGYTTWFDPFGKEIGGGGTIRFNVTRETAGTYKCNATGSLDPRTNMMEVVLLLTITLHCKLYL